MTAAEPHPGPRPLGSLVSPADLVFHQPAEGDPTWTETNWFGFFVPEATLRGSVYALFRTNLGVVRVAVSAYSRPCQSVLDLDYVDDRAHLPIPPDDLDDYHLANGLHVRMTKPLEEWTVHYEGRSGTVFDLVLAAHSPPVATAESAVEGAGPGYAVFNRPSPGSGAPTGHIDQTMWVTGEVRLGDTVHAVDFPSNRDHSWSPRREWGHNLCGNFDEGHFGRDLSFHVQTRNDPLDVGRVTHGYVVRQGTTLGLKAGVGHYGYDGWRIDRLSYELEDAAGRSYRITGVPVAWTADLLGGSYSVTAMVRWEWEGAVGWGDYKWHWDLFRMREHGPPGAGPDRPPRRGRPTGPHRPQERP
jgi:hypothetical protein